ncbi:hypothetical protein HYH03_008964 [Edaphochlamys debaryana]|uniref:BTB domain-containing protein n=1 Tax=Edaphochlamys debaryana TaxID=47281 RepID=A0A836BZ04_9CHLO|nr:hypothetical protein HYH03_008964 [Edaphochlamys debaryana]|eukprot:KAG2492804.1 hypothetical protein HYH03_008964 [Edaphochlamys debaryana]
MEPLDCLDAGDLFRHTLELGLRAEGVAVSPYPPYFDDGNGATYHVLCAKHSSIKAFMPQERAIVLGGELLLLKAAPSAAPGGGSAVPKERYRAKGKLVAPTWDPYSASVFMAEVTDAGASIMRIELTNAVSFVAGSPARFGAYNGRGSLAAFAPGIRYLASDGAGCLYVGEAGAIRKVVLPESLRAEGPKQHAAAGGGCSGGAGPQPALAGGGGGGRGRGGGRGSRRGQGGRGAAAASTEAVVSTIQTLDDELTGLAFARNPQNASEGHLVYGDGTAVYRIPVKPGLGGTEDADVDGHVDVDVDGDGDDDSDGMDELDELDAGEDEQEDEHEQEHAGGDGEEDGQDEGVDGVGAEASFADIRGMVAEASGSVVVVDGTRLRRVTPSGEVTTLAGLEKHHTRPAILPGGQLALCSMQETGVDLLDLGLDPVPLYPCPPAPPGPAPGSLAADLSALLEPGQGQAEGEASISDLKLRVGGRVFPVHRAILSARCPYFRRRLGGGFADAGAAELDLPDADPEAMEALLRWMYTGCLPPELPSPLLQPLAELSDRLGLMQPCRAAQGRILEAVCAQSVVGALLWAEQRGGGFAELLAGLKDWYLEHTEEIMDTALESLQRLAKESPALSVELQVAGYKRARTM